MAAWEFIKKTLTGYRLSYDCPECEEHLQAKLSEAGAEETCPQCGRAYLVPGEQEVTRFLRQQQAANEDKRKKQEEKTEWEDVRRRAEEQSAAAETKRRQYELERTPVSRRVIVGSTIAGILAGLVMLFYWLAFPTTALDGDVYNLGRMNDRLVGIIAAAAVFVPCVIVSRLGNILIRIHQNERAYQEKVVRKTHPTADTIGYM